MILQEMLRMPRLNDITAVAIDHTVDEISAWPGSLRYDTLVISTGDC